MIHGFKGNKTTTAEEWLIDYSLRTGTSIDINTNLLDMPITFDDNEIDAFILDVIDNRLVIQLALPLKEKFDDNSNRYEISYVRGLINSNKFLNRFNSDFVKHIQITEVHTENYVTVDKLWLLSHEEVGNSNFDFLNPNDNCITFEMFKTSDLKAYSQILLKHKPDGWRLRSGYSITTDNGNSSIIGGVNNYGIVDIYYAYNICSGTLCPTCAIC